MIKFKQKQYAASNPEKNPASYGKNGGVGSDVIINSGGNGGSSQAVRGTNQQIATQQMQAQSLAQSELSRQKTLRDANLNQIRREKYEGIQERAETARNRQQSAINQAKKQAATVGVREARSQENKKNQTNVSVYKLPTTRNTPISSNNRTQIRK